MDAKLVIVGGKANKRQVSVKLPTVIGRSREADLTVAHPMISRKHCELYEVDGLVRIRDLGSLNGLFVGRRQVNEAALHPNAEFTVGPLTFRIDYEYERRDQDAPSPEASTLDDTVEQPEEEAAPGPSLVATEAQPAIAPPNGGSPDFSAWEQRTAEEEDGEQAGEPSLPAPLPSFGDISGQDETAPETGGEAGPEPEEPGDDALNEFFKGFE